jgi:hypothetical protein
LAGTAGPLVSHRLLVSAVAVVLAAPEAVLPDHAPCARRVLGDPSLLAAAAAGVGDAVPSHRAPRARVDRKFRRSAGCGRRG